VQQNLCTEGSVVALRGSLISKDAPIWKQISY
jgi:hypothetical protein